MTPLFTKAIRGEAIEVYLKSGGDVLFNVPHNGPGGFGAIVKSSFITKSPDTIKNCLNNIQGTQIRSGLLLGP